MPRAKSRQNKARAQLRKPVVGIPETEAPPTVFVCKKCGEEKALKEDLLCSDCLIPIVDKIKTDAVEEEDGWKPGLPKKTVLPRAGKSQSKYWEGYKHKASKNEGVSKESGVNVQKKKSKRGDNR